MPAAWLIIGPRLEPSDILGADILGTVSGRWPWPLSISPLSISPLRGSSCPNATPGTSRGRVGGCVDGRVDGCVDGCMRGWVRGCVDGVSCVGSGDGDGVDGGLGVLCGVRIACCCVACCCVACCCVVCRGVRGGVRGGVRAGMRGRKSDKVLKVLNEGRPFADFERRLASIWHMPLE